MTTIKPISKQPVFSAKSCPGCKAMYTKTYCSCGYREVKIFVSLDAYFNCYSNDSQHKAFQKDFRLVPGYKEEMTLEIEANAKRLILLINSLFTDLSERISKDIQIELSSGWRPKSYAKEIGTSPSSNHCKGKAIDIVDIDNKLYDILNTNIDLIALRGMALEHKSATRTWLHIQSVTPPSGNIIFYP